MAYLIDEIKEKGRHGVLTPEVFQKAVAVDIQNVADYYLGGAKDEWFIDKDFPTVIPPFETTWIEYKMTDTVMVRGEQKPVASDKAGHRIGHLIGSYRAEDGTGKHTICTYAQMGDMQVDQMALMYFYQTNADGSIKMFEEGGKRYPYMIKLLREDIDPIYKDPKTLKEFSGILHPVFLAISFMHCKNVSSVVLRDSPAALNAKRARTGKPPITKVYTLVIEGVKKMLAAKNNGDQAFSKNAFHICRGHFKDFTHGQGLFGKYKGRYWWPMTTRGSKEVGEVVKDYAVKASC